MQVYVNGETRQIPPDTSMSALLDLLQLSGQRLAVEINSELVPRSTYPEHHLNDGDRVEIVHAIGGG